MSRFNRDTNTSRPPSLRNYGNTCYINAALQALCGSRTITQCIRDYVTRNVNRNPTLLMNALDSVSRDNKFNHGVNDNILQCILKDNELRNDFNINGHDITSLNVTHQSADLLGRHCLQQMMQYKYFQNNDLCVYKSIMRCTMCQTTRGSEVSPIIPIMLGVDLKTYIQGFPYITKMDDDNAVDCDICSRRTSHVKTEKLDTMESATMIIAVNRQDNDYRYINITEFLQLGQGQHKINTHELVGATLHSSDPDHFRAIRKMNNKLYWCNDRRINLLSHGYTRHELFVSKHATMLVYDKIKNLE